MGWVQWAGSCKVGLRETDGTRSFPVPFGAAGWMMTFFFGVENKEEETSGKGTSDCLGNLEFTWGLERALG